MQQRLEAETQETATEGGESAFDMEDGEAWSQDCRGKRRAMVRGQRTALAKQLRTTLGQISMATSPFKEKLGPRGAGLAAALAHAVALAGL